MSVDLKPCPFCGGRADSPEGPDGVTLLPRCTDCYAGPEDAAWNRRPMEDALRARAEAAEAEAARLTAALEQAQDGAELERGRVAALEMCVATGNDAIGEAHAEIARLRAAIGEALHLADIYAGVAAHNAEAEPETAGEAWRSPYMTTMQELRRALGGAR